MGGVWPDYSRPPTRHRYFLPVTAESGGPDARAGDPAVGRYLLADDLLVDQALDDVAGDAFGHAAIAGRVAELAGSQPAPLRIALYGPWGSGKSSQFSLLSEALKRCSPQTCLVRYDASTFGGKALQRNFISFAASSLGVPDDDSDDHRPYHRGLYEKRRNTTIDFNQAAQSLWPLALITACVFGALLLVFCVLAAAGSYLTPLNPWHQISASLPSLVAPSALAAVVIALGKAALDGGRVDTEEDTPSEDEEFARRLSTLLDFVHERDGVDRFVFFVDELDRCSADDIVSTLGALRTLLDNPRCVYIVAADRAVLERALDSLPQVTPINTSDPYYSSAGSYFDKVFQHSLELPPLRDQRLFNFAVRLVETRGGIWGQLRDGDSPDLQRVLYTLVPSHVRSPRRVKHLLNHFATSIRTIEARGLPWRERAAEVAKLSVLRVEFPGLAADLLREPRLPTMLIDPPRDPSPRVAELLAKHGDPRADGRDSADEDGPGPISEPADVPLIAHPPPLLLDTEYRNLIRYLNRVASVGVRDPGRDLLYLEPAGVDVGLVDSELAELLEAEAADRPDVAVAAIAASPPDQQEAAVAVLAAMADGARGDERTNIIRSLLRAAELSPNVPASAVDAVLGYDREQGLQEEDLPVALRTALRAKSDLLVEQLFNRDGLLAGAQLVETAPLADELPDSLQKKVTDTVIKRFDEDSAAACEAVSALSDDLAARVLGSGPVRAASAAQVKPGADSAVDPDLVHGMLIEQLDAVEDRPRSAVSAHWVLLQLSGGYDLVRPYSQRLLQAWTPVTTGRVRSSHALVALRHASADDAPTWIAVLETKPEPWSQQGNRACDALTAQLSRFTVDADASSFSEAAAALCRFIGSADLDHQSALVAAFAAQLPARAWWTSRDLGAEQLALHEAAHHVAAVLPEETAGEQRETLLESLFADILRPTQTVPTALNSADALRFYGLLGQLLTGERAARLLGPDLEAETVAGAAGEALHAEVRIRAAAGLLGEIDVDAFVRGLGSAGNVEAISEWLAQPVQGEQLVALATALSTATPVGVLRAAEHWAAQVTQAERDIAVEGLLDLPLDGDTWIRAVRVEAVDEPRLISHVLEALPATSRQQERQALASAISCRPLRQVEARRSLVEVIEALLALDKAGDFRIACSLVSSLGEGHRGGRRLRDAFARAATEGGHRIPLADASAFEAVGIRPPKSSFEAPKRSTSERIRNRLGLK